MSPRLLTALAVLLVACGSGSSTQPRAPVAVAAPPAAASGAAAARGEQAPLPLWSKVKRAQLPNGITTYVLEHRRPEKRALLWLAVNAGSVQEDDDQRGLAHFVEHMAFNGTKRFPKHELIDYLEKIGMSFGADLNASTGFDETVYQLTVPTDDPAHVAKGLDILRDWAGAVSFDPAEVDKERGVVLEEWRLGRGASMRVLDKQARVLFKGSRYAERIPIGLPEILRNAPREALVRYYEAWYRPEHMAVIAVGDFDGAAMERELAARFSDVPQRGDGRQRPPAGMPDADGTRVSIETDRELPAQTVAVFNMLPHRAESTPLDLRRIVVEQVYGSILGERLRTLARRPEAPFTGAFAGVQGLTREIDAFSRAAQVKGGRVEDALRSLFVEVLRVERHGFTAAELERARTNLARYADQAAVEEATRDSREYASEITRHFFEGELMIGRVAERDHTLAILPTITLDELNSLAKGFGGAGNRVIVIAGPDGKPLPSRERVLEIVADVAKSEIDPWQGKEVAGALMAQPPAPGKITREAKVEAIGVTEWTLSNGVRVIVKPTDFENDSLLLTATSPGGLALASRKDYASARFADAVAAVGGVGELDDDALRKVLTGKRAGARSEISEITEGVDAQGSTRDLATLLQLVHLRITAPRKDEQAIAVWRSSLVEELADQLRVPEVQFAKAWQEALFKGHPRRRFLEPADVEKLDADRAFAFFEDRFADSSDFTFVIVGEVDLAKLRPLVETYLASLPAKGRREKEKDAGVRRAGGVVKKRWAFGEEPKARVVLTFHGAESWTRDKERDLYILRDVLRSRLREVLREDLGGVYGVATSGQLVRSPRQERVFSIQFGCDPARVDELLDATRREIATIAKQGIDAEHLEKVRQQFLRTRETQLRQNGFWAAWLESAYRFGDDPTIVLDTGPVVARMTSKNVKAAARRFLDGKQLFQAVMMPAREAAAEAAPKP